MAVPPDRSRISLRSIRATATPSALQLGQLPQHASEAAARLAHMQALLELPDPRGDGMHNRHLQVALERLDDRQRAPAGAEHVDRVGALVAEKALLDMSVDLLGRELLHLVEGHVDA